MKTLLIIRKELKELLSEKTILVGVVLMPLILFPLLGATISLSFQSAGREVSEIQLVVVDNDGGKYAQLFVQALEKSGFTPRVIREQVDDIREFMRSTGGEVAIILEKGFTQSLSDGKPGSAQMYVYLSSLTINVFDRISEITGRVFAAGSLIGETLAAERRVKLTFYKNPVTFTGGILYRDQLLSTEDVAALFQSFFATGFFVPLVLLIVVATSGTVAATSIGLEKEAKTLEMLLTMPVSRSSILAAKLFGSTMIALMGTASMIFGLTFYLSSLPQSPILPAGSSLQLSPFSLLLLAVLLFVVLLVTLGLGIFAGVMAGDVRGGVQLAGLIQMPLILPTVVIFMFTDYSSLPLWLSTALLFNPFTHMMLALQALYTAQYLNYLLHVLAIAAFMAVLLFLASALFRGERLLTMRLQLSKRIQASA
ncbi:MAG: ABC transporter permease [Candidatus Caldarchaeum sp.]